MKVWKKCLAAVLAAICLPLGSASDLVPAAERASDAQKVFVEQIGSSIVIGNGYMEREFSTAGGKLETARITNKRTDNGETDFIPADGSEEFIIRTTKEGNEAAADREFAASALTVSKAPEIEDTAAVIGGVEKTGKKVAFDFAPYTFKGVPYTIREVIVMYDGDHFMRKYMEIDVPEDKKAEAAIDYIDLESLKVNDSDAVWTIPTNAGGIVQMEQFKANLGQPIYIQGMFFGCEFPAADNEIADGTGYLRYYTGKSFERMEQDNQLTQDGSYMTWQTVAGAARSTDNSVIQADFFEYIKSIATPSEFRIQYNSWFDNMMLIDDAKILDSFIEIDRELNQSEVRPLDSYVVDDGWVNYNNTSVVDAARAGTTLNQSGFWEFNSKFPEGLTPSSELVHNFGSNFGVWVGPRGGYNFYGSLADILVKSGKGSKAGGAIDVADRVYVKNFTDMAIEWMQEYGVNYWKWDGFADTAQFGAFQAADGVPGYQNHHMTGGYHHMYHVTDLWEAWIDLMEEVRQCEKESNIKNLWISLTCYVNPSPWYLQWANSVWLQCTHDQNDAGLSQSKMDRQLTYRDAAYYDFLKNHQFQFPLSNIYNHDPVYGKEGTGMNQNTATDEQFKNYLYMLATRGTAFWELYFSDSLMTEGKYEVTGEFLEWAEENYHILKNSKMIGESPNTGTVLGGSSNGTQNAYGYSCFDGTDGILSLRNSATTPKSITVDFDRTIGVPEDAGTLYYHIEHSHNLTEDTPSDGTLSYGNTYTFELQPDEVRILRISKDGDLTPPKFARVYSDGGSTVTVRFDEKVEGGSFRVNGTDVSDAGASADKRTFHLAVPQGVLKDNSTVTVTAQGVQDLAGNRMADNEASFRYYEGNKVAEDQGFVMKSKRIKEAADSLAGNGGFSASAVIHTFSSGAVLSQGSEYAIEIGRDGNAVFTLNGVAAVSKTKVNDGSKHAVTGVKENNGMIKIYIDGELEGAGYDSENRYYEVKAADITVGSDSFAGIINASVLDTAMGYDAVEEAYGKAEVPVGEQNWALGKTVTAKWTDGSEMPEKSDCPFRKVTDGIKDTNGYGEFGSDDSGASSYIEVDLGEVKNISRINLYRYWLDGRTYGGTVIALSETADFAGREIVYNSDADNFHGLGAGSDELYAESENGKSIVLDKAVNARYIRVYMHGRDGSNTNHIVELEAIGEQAQVTGDADYSAVDALISGVNAMERDTYKDFSAVDAAVAAVIRGKGAEDQAEVDAMAEAILRAVSALEEKEVPITAVLVAEAAKTLKVGESYRITASVEPETTTDSKALTYTSSNPAAASVDGNGTVTAVAAGETDITVASVRQGAAAKVHITVTADSGNQGNQGNEGGQNNQGTNPPSNTIPAVGTVFKNGALQYRVTKSDAKKGTVEVTGLTNGKKTVIVIPAAVKKDGVTFQVTGIKKNAFRKNRKLKTVTIGKNIKKIGAGAFGQCSNIKQIHFKGTKAPAVGKNAFSKVKANCKITVPKKMSAKQFSKLKKAMKSAGKKVKFVK